ncbi:TetR family transcriptional regulator C-terminal domain-containing protein [Nocardioides marmoribigeumensis]|uniref:AcrR family transcriptional regulator n=1 Tax=Nocardioides marmoribigeumensis TaxID=433649 RepID=A0ABU2BXT9_9ACTN|nr:TetR family transcriptional regulator C-terminal domain-containing protein [Nocardioides marmoribigeumensis]MDR7363216.1 AcrR family transcriptional regulator [Nocardioides marmoribigeumensis]
MAKSRTSHDKASSQTRAELLEAGLTLLMEQPASAAFGHLTAAKVANQAGRTTGAFFHQWPTLEAYLQDFIGFVLRPSMSKNLNDTVERLLVELGAGKPFAEALTAAGGPVPEETARDPQTVTELLMWNRALHDDEFREAVATHYEGLDGEARLTYEGLMELLGREVRPPFTTETIGSAVTAVAQGLALRASMTPGHYPPQMFGWMVLALIPLFTREPGDGREAQAYVDGLGVDVVPDADGEDLSA